LTGLSNMPIREEFGQANGLPILGYGSQFTVMVKVSVLLQPEEFV
jgi:hypothetical protein